MSRRSALVVAAAFAALAVLVAAGVFTHLDQWSIDHAMPGAHFRPRERHGFLEGLIPLYNSRWHGPWNVAVNLVTLPAGFLVSLALVSLLSRAAGLALLAAVLVEVVCKETLERPRLYSHGVHIVAFNSSFPSGHTLRTVIVAATVAWAVPRLRAIAAVWAIASLALLELVGWHTPTDIAGGIVLGALALLGARAAGALRRRRPA